LSALLNFIIVYLFIFLVFAPLSILWHELGHGLVALVFTRNFVTINLANWKTKKVIFSITMGRLTIKWRTLPGWTGNCKHSDGVKSIRLSTTQRMAFSLAGPFASFLLLIICAMGAYISTENLQRLFVGCAIYQVYLLFRKRSGGIYHLNLDSW